MLIFIKFLCVSLWKLVTLFKTRIKTERKHHHVLELNQSQWLKPYVEFNALNGDKDGKTLCKLMNNVEHGKTMENVKDRSDVKRVNNEKEHLKGASKSSYMSQKNIW